MLKIHAILRIILITIIWCSPTTIGRRPKMANECSMFYKGSRVTRIHFAFCIFFPLLLGLTIPPDQQIREMFLDITIDAPVKSLWLQPITWKASIQIDKNKDTNFNENSQEVIEEITSHIKRLSVEFKSCYVAALLNPLTPVPPVTACDEPWPFFHFWRHHLWPKLASSILNFCRRKRSC